MLSFHYFKILSPSKISLLKTSYNYGRNIMTVFDILPFFFAKSERQFTQDNGIPCVASRTAKRVLRLTILGN